VVGCWGPGPDPTLYLPGCTNSGCGTLASTTGAFESIAATFSTITAIFAALFM